MHAAVAPLAGPRPALAPRLAVPSASAPWRGRALLPPLPSTPRSCVVTESYYTKGEDFRIADAVFDCIGDAGEERFSLNDLTTPGLLVGGPAGRSARWAHAAAAPEPGPAALAWTRRPAGVAALHPTQALSG